jgi:hypothetical protein
VEVGIQASFSGFGATLKLPKSSRQFVTHAKIADSVIGDYIIQVSLASIPAYVCDLQLQEYIRCSDTGLAVISLSLSLSANARRNHRDATSYHYLIGVPNKRTL